MHCSVYETVSNRTVVQPKMNTVIGLTSNFKYKRRWTFFSNEIFSENHNFMVITIRSSNEVVVLVYCEREFTTLCKIFILIVKRWVIWQRLVQMQKGANIYQFMRNRTVVVAVVVVVVIIVTAAVVNDVNDNDNIRPVLCGKKLLLQHRHQHQRHNKTVLHVLLQVYAADRHGNSDEMIYYQHNYDKVSTFILTTILKCQRQQQQQQQNYEILAKHIEKVRPTTATGNTLMDGMLTKRHRLPIICDNIQNDAAADDAAFERQIGSYSSIVIGHTSSQYVSPAAISDSTALGCHFTDDDGGHVGSSVYNRNNNINNNNTWPSILLIFIIFAISIHRTVAGACWQRVLDNGKCNEIFSLNINKSECCGANQLFSYTDGEINSVEYFFATAIGGGMQCAPCLENCKNVTCGLNKKCVKRKGRPKCICAPECGASKRKQRIRIHHKHTQKYHNKLTATTTMPTKEVQNEDVGVLREIGGGSPWKPIKFGNRMGLSLGLGLTGKIQRDIRSLSSEMINNNLRLTDDDDTSKNDTDSSIVADTSSSPNQRKLLHIHHTSQGKHARSSTWQTTETQPFTSDTQSYYKRRILQIANNQDEPSPTQKPTTRRLQIFSNVRRNQQQQRRHQHQHQHKNSHRRDHQQQQQQQRQQHREKSGHRHSNNSNNNNNITQITKYGYSDLSLRDGNKNNSHNNNNNSKEDTSKINPNADKRSNSNNRHNDDASRSPVSRHHLKTSSNNNNNNNNNNNKHFIKMNDNNNNGRLRQSSSHYQMERPRLNNKTHINDHSQQQQHTHKHHHQHHNILDRKHKQQQQQQRRLSPSSLATNINHHHNKQNTKNVSHQMVDGVRTVKTSVWHLSTTSMPTIVVTTPANMTTLPKVNVSCLLPDHGSKITTSSSSSSSSLSATSLSMFESKGKQLPEAEDVSIIAPDTDSKPVRITIPTYNEAQLAQDENDGDNGDGVLKQEQPVSVIYDKQFLDHRLPATDTNTIMNDLDARPVHPVCGTDGRTYKTECQLKKRACRTNNSNLKIAYRGHCRTTCNGVKCLNGLTCVEDENLTPHCIVCDVQCPPLVNDLDSNGVANSGRSRAVCGMDGRTYKSTCDMNRMICKVGRAIGVAYPGPCHDDTITCDDINCGPKQVCLTDLLTHKPRCTTCRYKCSRKRHSPSYMRHIEESKICGVNNRTYYSWCEMHKDSCSTGYYINVKNFGECH